MAVSETARLIASLELQDKFSKNVAAYERAVGSMSAKTTALGRIGNTIGTGLRNTAQNLKTIGVIGAGALVAGAVGAARAAIDYEDAFAGIRKTVNETDLTAAGLTFESLSDSIRKMAREIPVAATELAAIGEAAGALGIRGQDIEDFTRVVAELSVTTDLTSDTASTALGQLGTTLHLTGDDFRDFGDSLVALGNAGASTESQIIDIAARFAAAGNSAGLSKEEVLALSSATASMGIEAESAGSSLSRVFGGVATNIGTSNKKAKAFADALGLSAKEFKKAWADDALGTFEDFLDKMNTLDQFQASALLKKIGITGVRDINAVRLMAQNVKFVNEQLAVSEHATDALGIEAAKKFATTASQLKILKNNFTDVGITIGSAVLPKITEMTGKLVEFINTPKAQKVIADIAAALPGGIDKLVAFGTALPWDSIGSAFKLMGEGAKAAMDIFLSAPPWLQTAIITGWGLNKLTGGALGNIVGALGSGLIKGVLGMNAGVVNINAAVVNGGVGGGVPTPTPGRFSLKDLLPFLGLAGISALLLSQRSVGPDGQEVRGDVAEGGPRTPRDLNNDTLNQIEANTRNVKETGSRSAGFLREATAQARLTAQQTANAVRMTQATLSPLERIAAKDFSSNVSVSTVVNVTNSATQITQSIRRLLTANATRLTDAGVGL